MDERSVTQTAGDNAAQYSAQNITINNNGNSSSICHALRKLVEIYKQETEQGTGSNTSEYIEKLSIYLNKVENDFQTLEGKLNGANFSEDISIATRLKQSYAKELQKIKHFNTPQKIHAYLLARILMDFQTYIYPLLIAGNNKALIKTDIRDKIVIPMDQIINAQDNVLELNYDELYGMIYFLTGNCHIQWS